MNLKSIYKAWNNLYTSNYTIYKPVYFVYKQISDRSKLQYIKKKLKKKMVVLDIGANIGFYSRFMSDCVGKKGAVYAFEPDKLNFQRLQENIAGRKNVVAEKKAVAETSKEMKLFFSDDMNVDHRTYDSGEGRSFTSIDAISIDQYLPSDVSVDFVKIDIQGYDYFAIKGMEETIARSQKMTIMGEFWPYGLKRAGIEASDYLQLLESNGFKVKFPDGKTLADLDDEDEFSYTDYIAKKK